MITLITGDCKTRCLLREPGEHTSNSNSNSDSNRNSNSNNLNINRDITDCPFAPSVQLEGGYAQSRHRRDRPAGLASE